MDAVATAGFVLVFTFSGPGPGPTLPHKPAALHGGFAAQSWQTQRLPAPVSLSVPMPKQPEPALTKVQKH